MSGVVFLGGGGERILVRGNSKIFPFNFLGSDDDKSIAGPAHLLCLNRGKENHKRTNSNDEVVFLVFSEFEYKIVADPN